jgi:putative copper export protein/methionine-rich copper-binding protein CopC
MTRRRAIAGLAGLIFGLLVVLISPASPASAHAALLETQPQSGAVLAEAPKQAVLTFSEPVRVVPGKIHIIGPDGEPVDGGKPTTEGPRLHIPMKPTTTRGSYLISYRVISADSHPISGGIPFSVGAPSANAPTEITGGARTDPTVTVLLGAARYLGYAGLVLVVGPAMFLALLWPRRLSKRGPLNAIRAGIGLLAFSTLAEQYLQAPYHAGSGLFGASAEDLREVFNSQFGAAHLVRIGVIAALTVLLPLFVNRPPGQTGKVGWSDRTLVAVLAVVGLATWPISGHPSVTSVPVLTTVADMAHLGSMAVWVGGLVVLFGFLLRRADARELGAILPVWSRWAMTAVTVLVLAGVTQALVSLGSISGLFDTTYGRLLLLKVGVLILVLAVAWYSRRLTLGPLRGEEMRGEEMREETHEEAADEIEAEVAAPARVAAAVPGGSGRITGSVGAASDHTDGDFDELDDVEDGHEDGYEDGQEDAYEDGFEDEDADEDEAPVDRFEPARRRLRRSVLVELIGTLLVLGLTATLVQTTPARAAQEEAAGRDSSQYNATLTTNLYSLQVQLEPKTTGANTIHLYAFTPNGVTLDVQEWKATAALPSRGIEPVELPVLPVTSSHAVAQAQLPTPGTWELRFTLRTTDIDAATVVAEVPIR